MEVMSEERYNELVKEMSPKVQKLLAEQKQVFEEIMLYLAENSSDEVRFTQLRLMRQRIDDELFGEIGKEK